MKKIGFSLAFAFLLTVTASIAQSINPDSTALALRQLTKVKLQISKDFSDSTKNKVAIIQRMLDVGMWKEAHNAIEAHKTPSSDYQLLSADYLILHNEFENAEALVNGVLKENPKNEKAILLKAFLEIQAWRLPQATAICEKAIKKKSSEKLQLMLGRIQLLQKNYEAATAFVKNVIKENPKNAGAYLLQADIYFWDQKPELAEAPLKKSLEIDPFNADARFSYGYAIWRRIDATQLNAMAAQWELALAINPLHYQTHWHWGNGHTNLTYADYAEKEDDTVRKALEKSDDEVRKNNVESAINITRDIEKQFPSSVLPLMQRASIYYIAFDMDRKTRLDSAENIFRNILTRKNHYGPAHNGLSAVIKSKRIPYLANFDSITNVLNHTQITDMENFEKVFPDVTYYPGNTVKAMVWNQLYSAIVYFPFLSKEGNVFRIPPLHIDLATSMKSSYFRYGTTFDNRQWMDIRGVGSGAAAIEYVERGAFQERNVILHEYVHLFDWRVLTDAEHRKIRSLYYKAMKEKRTLDYYSQNNESEYFAQTYPAYFEPVKVHPLDFKSMNTTSDLKAKDPEMYQFIHQLVKKEKAYLAGNKQAMASNWSQVYVVLSGEVKDKNSTLAFAYLDTALIYDKKYLPAYIARAQLKIEKKDFEEAEVWLKRAEATDSKYAPVYVAYANLVAARFIAKEIDRKTSVSKQSAYLKKAFQIENDYEELATINTLLREMYKKNAMIPEAIQTADKYVKNGSTVSTYLRDQRDDAMAFAAALSSSLGKNEAVVILKKLVEQKPQNFEYRKSYADVLAANKQYNPAIQTLKEAQRILAASGNARSDYNVRIAEFYNALGKKDSVERYLKPFLNNKSQVPGKDTLRYVRLLAITGHEEQATSIFKTLIEKGDAYYLAEYFFTGGKVLESNARKNEAITLYEKAMDNNPYLLDAYRELNAGYHILGEKKKADALQMKMRNLNIKL